MLDRITLKNARSRKHRGGVAWSGVVYLDGTATVHVENAGDGGCCRFSPLDGDYAAMRAFTARAEEEARKATGQSFEAFESLLSCMEEGWTAADAVTLWLTAMEA